ncbi:NUDIX domain-containing protein [Candidatus Roizmanbacteria bacterium]|nr:NUDIX domain-containing protein [Candidatus Roizmanbacteria bacterium]
MSYQFCPKCTKKLTKRSPSLYVCKNCGFHLYENPRPTNAVILENENGEILFIKREFPPKKNYWDLPGGFVNLNESLEHSVKREIKEELGFDIGDFRYVSSNYGRYLYKGVNYHTLCFTFLSKLHTRKVKTSSTEGSLRFFARNKIPLQRIAFIEVKKGLEKYLSSFQQSPTAKSRK